MGGDPRPVRFVIRPDRQRIATLAKGWMYTDEGLALHRYAMEAPTGFDLAEVGAYCGKSAIILGDAAEQRGVSLWSVDWHRGSPEMQLGRENHDPALAVDGHHDTLAEWRRNIMAAGLDKTVIGVVGQSVPVARQMSGPFGLVFIDADHGPPVLDDGEAWRSLVVNNGFLIFHDSSISWVQSAVDEACSNGCEHVERVDDMTVLRCVS